MTRTNDNVIENLQKNNTNLYNHITKCISSIKWYKNTKRCYNVVIQFTEKLKKAQPLMYNMITLYTMSPIKPRFYKKVIHISTTGNCRWQVITWYFFKVANQIQKRFKLYVNDITDNLAYRITLSELSLQQNNTHFINTSFILVWNIIKGEFYNIYSSKTSTTH